VRTSAREMTRGGSVAFLSAFVSVMPLNSSISLLLLLDSSQSWSLIQGGFPVDFLPFLPPPFFFAGAIVDACYWSVNCRASAQRPNMHGRVTGALLYCICHRLAWCATLRAISKNKTSLSLGSIVGIVP
jgi:hypothetical protein